MRQPAGVAVSGPGRSDAVSAPALLRLQGISHRYGQTLAVRSCNFDVHAGEIHGLVGENGSGKSTIVKILSGVIRPTEGTLSWEGQPLVLRSPRVAQTRGIVTVFQESLVVDEMDGQDNVFLGQDGLFQRHAGYRQERQVASDVLGRLGYDASILDRPAYALTIGQRQIVTIVRALVRDWKLLILDEATSALDLQTRDRLFDLVKAAVSKGSAVLFVSHRMEELSRLIDRSTVLRSGVTVATVERMEASTGLYLRLMSGHEMAEATPEPAARAAASARTASGEVGVRCGGLSVVPNAAPFDVEVRTVEILGVAGLEGHGGARFLSCLVGVEKPAAGQVYVRSQSRDVPLRGYRQAFASGIVYVPGNRQTEGLFAPLSVVDNLVLAVLDRLSTFGIFRARATTDLTREYVQRLGIEVANIKDAVSNLSGGNQQKVLVGRWLAARPRVLVMNDPLRGVDHATKLEFYKLLDELARAGAAVVLLSTEVEELVTVCDRVAVFHKQTLGALLEREQVTYDDILRAMFGQPAVARGGA
jgi:ABC-type sugar transport system ATPase subunit